MNERAFQQTVQDFVVFQRQWLSNAKLLLKVEWSTLDYSTPIATL
jgi:hypothetical protein